MSRQEKGKEPLTAKQEDVYAFWDLADSITRHLSSRFGVEFIMDGPGPDSFYRHDSAPRTRRADASPAVVRLWVNWFIGDAEADSRRICVALILSHIELVDLYYDLNSRY
jgi:hypothetical protein